MVPSAALKVPTRWTQVPVVAVVVLFASGQLVGLSESWPIRMNAHLPVWPSYLRKKPLIRLPSWLTMVCVPDRAVGLAHAETEKLCEVSTTGPLVAICAPEAPLKTAAESDQDTPLPAAAV